jgi:hypothetical protein
MRRLSAACVIASLALFGVVTGARSQPQSFNGYVWVGIKGWGTVEASRGVLGNPAVSCTNASCPADSGDPLNSRHVVLNEKPYKGWEFVGWHGGCKNKKPKCVLDAARAHIGAFGARNVNVSAKFIPVAAGLSRGHPLPIGAAANVGEGLVVKVSSANSNVPLSPAAPVGAEYFDANLTVTYTGNGSQVPNWFGFSVEGSHNVPYQTLDNDSCPYPGPQPRLDVTDPIYSYLPISGYVCWTIAANDASTLELYFGSGTLNYPGTVWFALHSGRAGLHGH